MKKFMVFICLIFIGFTTIYSIEVSPFLRGKTDRELIDYADALGNTIKYKISDEICAFSPAVRDYALAIVGRNELRLIHYSDILSVKNSYSSGEREELYNLISEFETQRYELREHLTKVYQ